TPPARYRAASPGPARRHPSHSSRSPRHHHGDPWPRTEPISATVGGRFEMDVRGLMRRSAIFHAGREAVVHGDDRLTFKEAWERGLRLANGLLALGLRPGDRVGVLEDNCLSAADCFIGLGAANLVR